MILFIDKKSEFASSVCLFAAVSSMGVKVLVYTVYIHQMTSKRIFFHFITLILMISEQY